MIAIIQQKKSGRAVEFASDIRTIEFTTEARRHGEDLKHETSRDSHCVSQSLFRASVLPWLSHPLGSTESLAPCGDVLTLTIPEPTQ